MATEATGIMRSSKMTTTKYMRSFKSPKLGYSNQKAPAPLKTPGPFVWQAKAPAPLGADVGQALCFRLPTPTFRTASLSPLVGQQAHANCLTVAVRFR